MEKTKDAYELDLNNMPQHVAFIMDGNRTWARQHHRPKYFGHHEGTKTVRRIALECNRLGIKAMTVYAFSTENFKREKSEVDYIFKLPAEFFDSYIDELVRENVQMLYIGHLELAPESTQNVIKRCVERTKNNTGLKLVFAFIYGGRDDIIEATKKTAIAYKNNEITLDDITEDFFDDQLMTRGLPPVDLMIRTSGEVRLSNFLLWQLSYAELIFDDTLWPDFDEAELHKDLAIYQHRSRRYGGGK